jgi:predicted HicB family RNase H-like nuclease
LLGVEVDDKEPTRVITVRLPKSIHEALRAEAHSRQISMNKLCITKLLRTLDQLAEAEESSGSHQVEED